ncbi:MAG: response regulator transcription factor, partial [Thermoguttaceae bacterium]|nr:response regulator transcription factor [Thermoguttaceae bacterium]
LQPDVVVIDVCMPRLNGIEATRRLLAERPGMRVIGLSMHQEEDMARAMREAGAVAYLSKDTPADVLIPSILDSHPE